MMPFLPPARRRTWSSRWIRSKEEVEAGPCWTPRWVGQEGEAFLDLPAIWNIFFNKINISIIAEFYIRLWQRLFLSIGRWDCKKQSIQVRKNFVPRVFIKNHLTEVWSLFSLNLNLTPFGYFAQNYVYNILVKLNYNRHNRIPGLK